MSDVESASETITPKEARRKLGSGESRALDVRSVEARSKGTVSGSIHVPADEVSSRLDELPDDQLLIVFSDRGEESAEVAAKLRDEGREAVSLEGGMASWEEDRMPVQPSEDPEKEEGGPNLPI
jgi:tRNA 2-thiocytidine biosynthesis protein TtcA